MNTTRVLRRFMASHAGRATSLSIVMFIGISGATLLCLQFPRSPEVSGAATYSARACTGEPQVFLGRTETVPVSRTHSTLTSTTAVRSDTGGCPGRSPS